ncbi:MAG: hypothetical protein L3J35_13120 [Bacteroidales bacterium]|nr:hypothetical protein [Bacteroidales bacterium]
MITFFVTTKSEAQLAIGTTINPYTGDIYHTGGNIGIGVEIPKQLLHLFVDRNVNSSFSVMRLETVFQKGQIYDKEIWDIIDEGNLSFKYNNTFDSLNIMSLTSAGQLYLGTLSPVNSAALQIESTNKGLLIPRLSTSQKNAISSPANALLVFDTDLQAFSYYDTNAASWMNIPESNTFSNYLLISDFNNSVAGSITQSDTVNWNTAYDFSQNFTETDPVFSSHISSGITAVDTANWNTAFSWGNHADAGYLTGADINILWQENSNGNIYRKNGYVGIGTTTPSKYLEIYTLSKSATGSSSRKTAIRLFNKVDTSVEYPKNNNSVSDFTTPAIFYKWDIENANDTLKLKYIRYNPDEIVSGQNIEPETKFSFSGNGTLTATKFTGDGSDLTNIKLNGLLILDNEMEAWTNNGWSARLQSPLGTVWASTNKSSLGDYYLGLGMTNSGWYFINKYQNKDYNYVAVIREDGKILCKELEISKSSGGYWNTPFIKVKKPTNSDLAAFGFETNLQHWVIAAISSSSTGDGFWIKDIKNNTVPFKITNTGVVEIHDKLWVADEIAVQATNPWPDYVFDKDYKLISIEKLQEYIKQNGHLPNIPTSEDVKKEGIKLARNQTLLLQKIEELTLYIIEQDKRIKQLEQK